MNVVKDLSIGKPPEEINVFIEIPRGSKNKYEVDKDTGLITLDRVAYTAFAYPLDYGLVPQTLSDDGDPLDALILNAAEPYYPGVVVPARPIAVINMIDDGEGDEKLICVPADSPQHSEVKDKDDIAPHLLKELTHFYEHYKDLQNKQAEVKSIEGRDAAQKVLQEAIALYKKQ